MVRILRKPTAEDGLQLSSPRGFTADGPRPLKGTSGIVVSNFADELNRGALAGIAGRKSFDPDRSIRGIAVRPLVYEDGDGA